MTPEQFVIDLKKEVREGVASEIEYFIEPPPGSRPREHLAMFSNWYQSLSENDKEIARMVMEHAAEGSLFMLLNVLDNVMSLPSSVGGQFELYYVDERTRVRLNDPEGDFLYDIFNNAA